MKAKIRKQGTQYLLTQFGFPTSGALPSQDLHYMRNNDLTGTIIMTTPLSYLQENEKSHPKDIPKVRMESCAKIWPTKS